MATTDDVVADEGQEVVPPEKEDVYAIEDEDEAEEKVPAEPEAKEKEAGVEEPNADTGEGESTEVVVDPDLLAEAETLGLSREFAEGLGKSGMLEQALSQWDLRALQIGKQEVGPAEVAGEVKPAPTKELPDDAFKIELADEDSDPEIVKAIKGMNAHYAPVLGEVKKLTAQLAETQEQLMRERVQKQTAWFDSKYADLGDEWTEVLGKQVDRNMNERSDQYKNRVRLVEAMNALDIGYKAQGKQLSDDVLFNRALRTEFGDSIAAQERKKLAGQVQKSKGSIVARPNKGRAKQTAVSGEQKAIASVNAWRKEHGKTEEDIGEEEF